MVSDSSKHTDASAKAHHQSGDAADPLPHAEYPAAPGTATVIEVRDEIMDAIDRATDREKRKAAVRQQRRHCDHDVQSSGGCGGG